MYKGTTTVEKERAGTEGSLDADKEYAPAIIVPLDPSRAESDDVTAYHRASEISRYHEMLGHGAAAVIIIPSRLRRSARERGAESRRVSPPTKPAVQPRTGVYDPRGTPTKKKKRKGRVYDCCVARRVRMCQASLSCSPLPAPLSIILRTWPSDD